jgi:predicted 2-oxoglutarate/Fe(II)-dependent dioxygenase YbiX
VAKADFFVRRGLFAVENFFEPDTCAVLCDELRGTGGEPHTVEQGGVFGVDHQVGRTSAVGVASLTAKSVERRLSAVQAELERCFGVPLVDHEKPTFVRYQAGDYFRPHTDVGNEESPAHLQARKVVLVGFLNDRADTPTHGCYCGGALTLYGVIDEPPWREMGFSVDGQAGTVIAFPARMVHEVTEVTHGDRCVVVSRYG